MSLYLLPPQHRSFFDLLLRYTRQKDLQKGKAIHAQLLRTGSCCSVYLTNSLVNLYAKCGSLLKAKLVFESISNKDVVSWNCLINGYSQKGTVGSSFVMELFQRMRAENTLPNAHTFSGVFTAASSSPETFGGLQAHALAIKTSNFYDVFVGSSLINMYCKIGCLLDARKVFDTIPERNIVSWATMISGYAMERMALEAWELFLLMRREEGAHDKFIYTGVLSALTVPDLVRYVDARKGFDYLKEPDIVLWTSMISGYAQNGENETALTLYCRMQMEGILPHELTMASVLRACSSLAALEQGKQIHAQTIKYGFSLEVPIGSALSTMYAKCGSVEDGNLVFRRMPTRDIMTWNAMISGLSQNGEGLKALELFEEMRHGTTKPDYVTFVNVLSACSHMGLVERGKVYFRMMLDDFGIVPRVEHYACMVDILSRAGKLHETKEFIESATIDHGMCLWRILLGACRNYRNYELGAYAGEKLMELGSQESSAYILLSSIYTALGRSDDVERVRRLMKLRGVNKEPGCSWIELKSQVHVFVVGDQIHPQIFKIRSELRRLRDHMKDECYESFDDTNSMTLYI
uniref:Pentatricopeptide repeat-containing protein n=1 Tax=Cucumis melo TaxID=3656 RepID=A0A9I9D0H3_CUCME